MPEGLRGGTLEAPDLVTALVLYDTGTEHELSPARKHFTRGAAPDQDIAIHSPFVSARHCRLDREIACWIGCSWSVGVHSVCPA